MTDQLSLASDDSIFTNEASVWQDSEADERYALSDDDAGDTHYFGDEAEGLKYADDSHSYDLGYYSDPDDGDNLFVLEDAESPDFGVLSDGNFKPGSYMGEPVGIETPAQTEHSVEDLAPLAELTQEVPNHKMAEPAQPDFSEVTESFSFSRKDPLEANNSKKVFPRVPETARFDAPVTGELPKSEIEDAFASYVNPMVSHASPAKLPVESKQPGSSRKSIVDALNSFEQEVLLKDSRFLKSSIDALVNGYFSQQDA